MILQIRVLFDFVQSFPVTDGNSGRKPRCGLLFKTFVKFVLLSRSIILFNQQTLRTYAILTVAHSIRWDSPKKPDGLLAQLTNQNQRYECLRAFTEYEVRMDFTVCYKNTAYVSPNTIKRLKQKILFLLATEYRKPFQCLTNEVK